MLARVREDERAACEARRAFDALRGAGGDPYRTLLVEETLAFTAEECGEAPGAAFRRAAHAARAAGERWKAESTRWPLKTVSSRSSGKRQSRPGWTRRRNASLRPRASAIHVRSGERIGVQVERTVRDWISYQFGWDLGRSAPAPGSLVPWHEGSRLQEILVNVPARVVPLSGTLAARRGDRWLAADEHGVFRFEVLADKMQYPPFVRGAASPCSWTPTGSRRSRVPQSAPGLGSSWGAAITPRR